MDIKAKQTSSLSSPSTMESSTEKKLLLRKRRNDDDDDDDDDDDLKSRCGFAGMKTFVARYGGILFGVLTGILNSLVHVASKELIVFCEPSEIGLYRWTMHLPINVVFLMITGQSLRPHPGEEKYILYRSVLDIFANVLFVMSLKYLPYLDSIVICIGSMALSAAIVGRIWLSEMLNAFIVIMILTILAGVILSCQPTIIFQSNLWESKGRVLVIGCSLSITSGIWQGIASCINRKILETSPLTTSLYTSVCGLLVAVIQLIITKNNLEFCFNSHVLIYAPMIGVGSVVLVQVWCRGLQIGSATELTLAAQIEIPLGILLQYVLIQEDPNLLAVVGSVLIVSSIMMMALQEHILGYFKSETDGA